MTIWIYDLTHTLTYDLADPDQAGQAWDEIHAVSTLQGIVNRHSPRLYLRYVEHDGRNIDDWWLDQITAPGAWLSGAERRKVASLEELVRIFRQDLSGAVLYDPRVPATSNVASTLAGTEDLVAVRWNAAPGSVYERLVQDGPQLPVKRRLIGTTSEPLFTGRGTIADSDAPSTGSTKCDAYLWAKHATLDAGKCNTNILAYYLDSYWTDHATRSVANQHMLTNHDYFVARRAFFCDLHAWGDEAPIDDPNQTVGTDLDTLRTILHSLHQQNDGGIIHVGGFTPWAFKYTDYAGGGGRHGGVDTEWELVRVVSAYNGFLDADAIGHGAMANASFFMHFPLARQYSQAKAPTSDELATAGHVDVTVRPDMTGTDYVMFYVGDYDAAAWLYQRLPDLWNDPRRGDTPLSWAISPALCLRAPMAMDYLWRTRTGNDSFISADNGAGYLMPNMLVEPRPVSGLPSGLSAWAEHCRRFYQRWDLKVTGFVIDGHGGPPPDDVLDAYARFSPDGLVAQHLDTPQRLYRGMPVLRAGPDLNQPDPADAAAHLLRYVTERRGQGLHFHWCRTILRSPTWHAQLVEHLCQFDTRIEVVGAPAFFDLLRRSLTPP